MSGRLWQTTVIILITIGILARDSLAIALALLAGCTLGLARLWQRICLNGVSYERRFSSRRAFPGETVPLRLLVANDKALPLPWLETRDEVPAALQLLEADVLPSPRPERHLLVNLVSLRWYERIGRRYEIVCSTRGRHAFGPARLVAGDVFGLMVREVEVPGVDHLLVYPRVLPLENLGLPSRHPFGDRAARRWILPDPLRTIGVRPYAPGDGFRDIHWKASARTAAPQVKVHEPATTQSLALFLNVATYDQPWQGTIPHLLEEGITAAASIARDALARRYAVGLYCNGSAAGNRRGTAIRPGRSPGQLTAILESLAMVTALDIIPLEELALRESRRLPWQTILAVISAACPESLSAALVRLSAQGFPVHFLAVGDRIAGPPGPGIAFHRLRGGDGDDPGPVAIR